MPNIYRGVDIAGDQGQTGFVDLVEEDDGRLWARCVEVDLTGREGLEALINVEQGERLVAAAIDQPLGFPAGTLRLLACPDQVVELPAYDSEHARFREADIEMREDLKGKEKGLKVDYVRPPVVCDNIWRAVYLVRAAGGDVTRARRGELPWFETHPRLCVLGLLRHAREVLSLLAEYKVKKLTALKAYKACKSLLEAMRKAKLLPPCLKKVRCTTFHLVLRDPQQLEELSRLAADFAAANEGVIKQHERYGAAVNKVGTMLSARRRCLELLTSIIPVGLSDDVLLRLLDVSTSDPFEALFCAVAAYAKAKAMTRQYPRRHPRDADIDLEGLVFVPDFAKLRTVTRQPERQIDERATGRRRGGDGSSAVAGHHVRRGIDRHAGHPAVP